MITPEDTRHGTPTPVEVGREGSHTPRTLAEEGQPGSWPAVPSPAPNTVEQEAAGAGGRDARLGHLAPAYAADGLNTRKRKMRRRK